MSDIDQQLDQEIVAAYQAGETQTAIAERHGVSRRKITGALRRAGVPHRDIGANRGPRSLIGQEGDDVAELYRDGVTIETIIETYKVARATVIRCLREHDLEPPARPAPKSRFEDHQKRAMAVRRWELGWLLRDIAIWHDCSISTAKRITDALKPQVTDGSEDQLG